MNSYDKEYLSNLQQSIYLVFLCVKTLANTATLKLLYVMIIL